MNMLATWIRKRGVWEITSTLCCFSSKVETMVPKAQTPRKSPKTSSQPQRTSHTQERKEKWEGVPRRGLEEQDDNSTLVAWDEMRCEHRGCLYRVSRGVEWQVCAENLPILQNFVPPKHWKLASKLGFGNQAF